MLSAAINVTKNEAQSWLHSYEPLANQAMGLLKMVDVTLRPITTIVCSKCETEKPYTDFPSEALQSRTKHCKSCRLIYAKEWRRLNPEKQAARRARQYKTWREKYPKIDRPPAVTEAGRLCSTCKQRKPPEAFRRNIATTDRRMWRCRDCINKSHRDWYAANIDHARDAGRGTARKLRAESPSRTKENLAKFRMKRDHGITWQEYEELIAAHDSKCAICDRHVVPIPAAIRAECACVDHDHGTGRIRGILCHACNRGIGMLRDDVDILKRAISYLEGGSHRKRSE